MALKYRPLARSRQVAGIATSAVAVLSGTGCTGGSASTENISAATLRTSVAPGPPASPVEGEVWRKDTANNAANPQTVTLAQLRGTLDSSQQLDLKKLERAGFRRFYASQWRRPANQHGGVNAEGVANLFRDAGGALAGNDAIRSLSRRQDPGTSTPDVAEIPPLKLGKRGWGFHLSGGDEAFDEGKLVCALSRPWAVG
jgi:hypothetical protein